MAINRQWDASKSTLAGDYILAVGSKILAQIRHDEVLIVLSQVRLREVAEQMLRKNTTVISQK